MKLSTTKSWTSEHTLHFWDGLCFILDPSCQDWKSPDAVHTRNTVRASYRTECPTGATIPLILHSSYSSTLPPVHFIRKFYIGRTNESCSHFTTFFYFTTIPFKSIHGFYKFMVKLQEKYLTIIVSIITCF
jgi:hypothetical protein